ncbi:unnamed protein product [Effrenium voratum]|nr:unnamed protein product [Effrenium voratum]
MPRIPRTMLDNSTDGGSGNQSADPMARVLREELEGYNDSDLSNETNATEMPLPFDPDSPGAIHVPSSSCFIWHATVTCTLPALMRGRAYSVHYTHGAFREEGGLVKAGPRNPAPAFRVIDDRHIMFPHILSLTPALMEPSDARRLDTFALAPKPMWYAPRGAILALEFSVPVQLGPGLLNLVDCSPGNSSRRFGVGSWGRGRESRERARAWRGTLRLLAQSRAPRKGNGFTRGTTILAVCRWSANLLHSRLLRVWGGDASLPLSCHACTYLFRPSRLPTPFQSAERFLPQACNCTGVVGCKFPGGGPGRLEPCRVEVEPGR